MEPANIYETALFVMCRQRLVYLGAARGKTPEVTKRIAQIYG